MCTKKENEFSILWEALVALISVKYSMHAHFLLINEGETGLHICDEDSDFLATKPNKDYKERRNK